MTNIFNLPLANAGKETPKRILEALLEADIEDIVAITVIDGEVITIGSQAKITDVLGLIELGKHKVLLESVE